MPGVWPDFDQIFGQVFDQIFGQVFDQGFDQVFDLIFDKVFDQFFVQKYSFVILQGQNIQCTVLLGQKNQRNPVKIQNKLGTRLNPPSMY